MVVVLVVVLEIIAGVLVMTDTLVAAGEVTVVCVEVAITVIVDIVVVS